MGIFRQFPYANFHDLNLDWLIENMQTLIKEWAEYQEKWNVLYDDVTSAFDDFKKVFDEHIARYDADFQNYINSINITTELRKVFDQAVADGTVASIINPVIATETTRWLSENITEPTGVVIDKSLSIDGACADAKATGDADKKLYNMIGEFNVFDCVPYMQHNNATHDGVTWEWVDDTTVHVNGTATQTTGINLFASTNSLPPFMKAGHYYSIILEPAQSESNIFLEIYDYSGGTATRLVQVVKSTDFIRIPDNVTGMIIRLRIFGGQVASTDVTVHIVDPFDGTLSKFANMFEGSISANYPKANMDLNDVTGNKTYIVAVAGVQNAPLTEGAGILICSGSDVICTQLFIFSTGLVYTRYINKNTSQYSEWTAIKPLDAIYRLGASITVGDLNDYVEAGYIFVSDPNTIQNLPVAGAGFLWIYRFTSTGIVYQEYTDFTSMKNYRRRLFNNNWGSWVEGGSGSGGTIENTYNITTTPTIETSTDNWLYPVDGDNTGAIMSMLTDTGICRLAEGVFNVSGNIDMPAGSTIEGCGKNTVLRLMDSVDTGYIIKVNSDNTVKNLTLKGAETSPTFSESTNRSGIYFTEHNSPQHNILSDLFIENFTNSGIYCNATGGGIKENIIATNICIDACKVGINIAYYSEYHKFTNCVIRGCDTACINNGGNNIFVSCTFNGSTGFVIDNSNGNLENPGHGSCVGCSFNHIGNNTGKAIVIKGNAVTFTFSACQHWYGSVDIQNSKGIIFGDCAFGGSPKLDVVNSTAILFSNCIFYQVPVITNTGNTSFIMSNCYHSANGLQILP